MCPVCLGRPPMRLQDGRLVPERCERCEGRGVVAAGELRR